MALKLFSKRIVQLADDKLKVEAGNMKDKIKLVMQTSDINVKNLLHQQLRAETN